MKTNSFNIIVRLQRWMDSVPGQTFLNYAYSWGASIVILGALFKLTHLFGADIMLFIGMGTEVIVFFLSAFDRPFDTDEEALDSEENNESGEENEETDTAQGVTGGTGATIILRGGTVGGAQASDGETPQTSVAAGAPSQGEGGSVQVGNAGGFAIAGSPAIITDAENAANPELGDVTQNYVEKLKELTEVLTKVEEQSRKMTTDSEEMINLNRTLTGINTVYELQLKNISSQIGTIDQINEQTRKMAKQIEELNGVYSRMIKALTVNMKNAAAASSVGDDE